MKKIIVGLILLTYSFGQSSFYGMWKNYFSFKKNYDVEARGETFYITSDLGIIKATPKKDTVSFITKLEGLNSLFPTTLAFDIDRNLIAVGYKDGTIDLINQADEITPYFDIKQNKNVLDKGINAIQTTPNYWFIATNFGLLVFNPDKKEIKYNYLQIGNNSKYAKVSDVAYFNDSLWCVVGNKLWVGKFNGINLALPSQWTLLDSLNYANDTIFPASISVVEANDSFLVIGTDEWLYYRLKKDPHWRQLKYHVVEVPPAPVGFFSFTPYSNFDLHNYKAFGYQNNSLTLYHQVKDSLKFERKRYTWGSLDASIDSTGEYVLITETHTGPVVYYPRWFDEDTLIIHNDLLENQWGDAEFVKDRLFLVGKGRNGIDPAYISSGITEVNLKTGEISHMTKFNGYLNDIAFSLNKIYYDSLTNSLFIASWQEGLLQYDYINRKVIKEYTPDKYPIGYQTPQSNLPFHLVGDVKRDRNGVLWVALFRTNYPLCAITPDEQFYNFRPTTPNARYSQLIIDDNNYKWIVAETEGLLVFDDNGTPDNPLDDRKRLLGTGVGNGDLPNIQVNAIAKDRDGNIWVGTASGVRVFYNTYNIFTPGPETDAICPVLNFRCLLEDTRVNAIVVDGANRKWIGTDEGIYLVNEDGTEELLHFTTQNSPLISDYVYSLELNKATGELFIITDIGAQSYTIDAIDPVPAEEVKDSLFVFPNPVKPDYDGPITIRGVVENAIINITTIDGQLIRKLNSLGGQAIWDGRDFYGNKLAPGVYIIFVTNARGEVKASTKLAFLKRYE